MKLAKKSGAELIWFVVAYTLHSVWFKVSQVQHPSESF